AGGGMILILFLPTDSEDRENLIQNRVTHILSVHNNARPVLEDMTYLCISVSDSSSQNLIQHFKESIRFIHECRLHGGGCLIHWSVLLSIAPFAYIYCVFCCYQKLC
uniref:Uncharacterized protein n=1 Tax=Chelydra serpentina TaxID=8475 RepID=A0A8C3S7H1_CHESE